jgi:hypothetical protein
VADLNLVQKHVSHGNLNIEEASQVALRGIRKDFLKAVFRSGKCVADEFAGNAGIGAACGDLRSVVVQCFGLAEIDLEILAAANISHIDGHDFRADEKVLAVAAAFVNGLRDVAPDGGGC